MDEFRRIRSRHSVSVKMVEGMEAGGTVNKVAFPLFIKVEVEF